MARKIAKKSVWIGATAQENVNELFPTPNMWPVLFDLRILQAVDDRSALSSLWLS